MAKTGKSFGVDNIPILFLKLALSSKDSLARSINFMCPKFPGFLSNTSIETNSFPESWKIARVTHIFKNGGKADKSNYRPISVLPIIARLFEKL